MGKLAHEQLTLGMEFEIHTELFNEKSLGLPKLPNDFVGKNAQMDCSILNALIDFSLRNFRCFKEKKAQSRFGAGHYEISPLLLLKINLKKYLSPLTKTQHSHDVGSA